MEGARNGGGRRRWRWGWVVGALIAVLLATAATSRNSPRNPLSGITSKLCQCTESRKYTGIVEDCCCDYETVDSLNKEVLHPILQDLVTTPFFRYFKLLMFLLVLIFSDPSGEFCQEKKVLYKLISGLHSSISVHIASDYLLDETDNLWGENLELLYDRVLKHPERVRNLYFTYLFVLRAATKAPDYLKQAEYNTGNLEEDLKTQSLVRQLVYNTKLQTACPLPFDEAKLWQGESGPELKQQIQKQFRNISALMDCVGCEKCRLWGKLQILGLGTALKILFSVDHQNYINQQLQLQRNEVIALMNLLNRLSESVKFVHDKGPFAERIL
ncbi:ubiquitin-conjugating enzyme E2 [Musa troglodytarum]|uniref:Ubiquitin-conjugating enzyme E2 n=1 Tax=Musa troglodytarum TaxID=320322 RepID=A0A9E7KS14_9LILI|nr:ubiquitin-conjugating enzyme E2 [Musa troglodytarum]